jgi:2-polyprenyl-3-methyl-5-hydroxy-6-metoxy-1,4-benzoquinol methylase
MNVKISGGVKQDGIVIGNAFDKYASSNVVVRWLMRGFDRSLSELIAKVKPRAINEVGCGEGYWVIRWSQRGFAVTGCDFSSEVIGLARENAVLSGISPEVFEVRSIYDLESGRDNADLIVCCEVLEHLEIPELGLQALQKVVDEYLIVSVPREPLWCAMNFARGKYLKEWGNTPGHLQHWSKRAFIRMVSNYFDVIDVKSPIPWTMLLCRPKSKGTH